MGFRCDLGEVTHALQGCREKTEKLSARPFWKIRLMLAADGTLSVSAAPIELPTDKEPIPRAVISTIAVSSADPIPRHKTTRRSLYEPEPGTRSARTRCFD